MNDKYSSLPVLIVAYKRLENVEKLILDCISHGSPRIYLAVDKSIENSDFFEKSFSELASRLNLQTSVPITVWFRKQNYGLAASMLTAINWFFNAEEAGYILEDDLAISKSFFTWGSYLLEQAKENDQVWLISGNNYESKSAIRKSNYPLIWGWCTTEKKWTEMLEALLSKDLNFSHDLPLKLRIYWSLNYKKAAVGKIDSWAMLLASSMRSRNKICMLPPANLVSNLGSDLIATHTSRNIWPIRTPINESIQNNNLREFPVLHDTSDTNLFIEEKIYEIRNLKIRWLINLARLTFLRNSQLERIEVLLKVKPETVISYDAQR